MFTNITPLPYFNIKSESHKQPSYPKFVNLIVAAVMLLVWFYLALPSQLFTTSYSTVLVDADNRLLGARVADDEQWRFPKGGELPDKYVVALLMSEDRHFYEHRGVYFPSLVKALWQNSKKGRFIRGGSTITMQVIRLSQGNPPRRIPVKIAEMLLAYRLEVSYSKDDILKLYAEHAPFGSNVVGLEAASWRYFDKSSDLLSWAEAATLAVLPNSPGQVYPGKNNEKLFEKRNRLLKLLEQKGIISEEECYLSMSEPLPNAPAPIQNLAPHLLARAEKEGMRGEIVHTTIKLPVQSMAMEVARRHIEQLESQAIHNMAILIIDTRTGGVLAYIGNATGVAVGKGEHVDVITSRRSSGSILKPFLYAMMLDDGLILPGMLIPDVPIEIGSFRPANYSKTFSGAVPARKALARSLNIPAVLMLRDYGTARFCEKMRKLGMSTLERPASHYGLSVVLGGAETKLWELCGFYASMGRVLHTFSETDGKYRKGDVRMPIVFTNDLQQKERVKKGDLKNPEMFHASSVWCTFEAMKEVARPDEEANWSWFSSMSSIAWKTGTSFGNRDAWAVGVNPRYVVGVWVGNAGGEGRPELTGTSAAAPVLFDLFSRLPKGGWFDKPWDDMTEIAVCRQSGYLAGTFCIDVDTIFVPNVNHSPKLCPYHQVVHLDSEEKYRVSQSCVAPSEMVHQSWFVLPPLIEYYYKPLNPFYKLLPPWKEGCRPETEQKQSMDIIYPVDLGKIIIPTDISGKKERVVFEVAHSNRGSVIYWYLDDDFIGTTELEHKKSLNPSAGWHVLTLTDSDGNRISRRFKIVELGGGLK